MTVTQIPLEQLKLEIQQLDSAVRAGLAEFLIRSLDAPADERTDEEFDAELDKRLGDMRSGRVKGRPAEEVLAELHAKLS